MKQRVVIQLISGLRDGGAETLVKDYATLMGSGQCRVVIVCILPPDETSANVKLLRKVGVEIISVYCKYPLFKSRILQIAWNKLLFKQFIYFRLKQIIEQLKPTCIHVHLEILRYIKPISKHLKGVKLLYTCHSLPSRYFNNTSRKVETQAAKHLIRKNCLQFIALHDQMRVELNNMFDVDNTLVVHNGVDFNRFKNISESKDDIRKSIGVPPDSFVIGHIGRFFAPKNHTLIVDIFHQIAQRDANAHLLLVGDGSLKQEINAKLSALGLQGRYTILSHRSDIPQLLKAMDIFLFPSLFEGLPVTLVEAQVVGLRCIVSNHITSECFFSHDVVPLDIEAPLSTWVKAVTDPSIRGEYIGDINQFNMQCVIQYLEKIYIH